MALVASEQAESRAFSNGPICVQIMKFSVANGDTSGTITATSLKNVTMAVVTGITMTAAPTFAANVVTLAFADPLATVHGQVILYGTK